MGDFFAIAMVLVLLFGGAAFKSFMEEWSAGSIVGDVVYGLILLAGLAFPLIYFLFIR